MKTRAILFLSLLFISVACQKAKSTYSKFDTDFENNRWTTSDEKKYSFEITDDSKNYTIDLKFSHIYNCQYEKVPLRITISDPNGNVEQIPFVLKIKDASGKQLSDCTGDVCDVTVPFKENIRLSKGNYTLTITNTFTGAYLPNVLGVGLEVKTVE